MTLDIIDPLCSQVPYLYKAGWIEVRGKERPQHIEKIKKGSIGMQVDVIINIMIIDFRI